MTGRVYHELPIHVWCSPDELSPSRPRASAEWRQLGISSGSARFCYTASLVIDDRCTGQISASLAAMNRTIDDYDSMAKREMIKAKQEKAQM